MIGTISIHAPTGGATHASNAAGDFFKSFNPRAHGGRDHERPLGLVVVYVSIHAPTGGATTARGAITFGSTFQSTRPRGARQVIAPALCAPELFQSTRPRGARPAGSRVHPGLIVSIHAPTGGATPKGDFKKAFNRFQSTRPRGARQPRRGSMNPRLSFNPRAHGGRDRCRSWVECEKKVSIHAPTGGATLVCVLMDISGLFQSTRPRGARQAGSTSSREAGLFQSTRPRGARPGDGREDVAPECFNPRAHGGRDRMQPGLIQVCLFQSTRPRGARLSLIF